MRIRSMVKRRPSRRQYTSPHSNPQAGICPQCGYGYVPTNGTRSAGEEFKLQHRTCPRCNFSWDTTIRREGSN